MVYNFSEKKTGLIISVNEQPAEELHIPVIKKLKQRNVYARFKDIFEQQIQLKWDHSVLRIKTLNIYYVS